MIAVGPLVCQLHMYLGYYVSFSHKDAIFDVHHTWKTMPASQRGRWKQKQTQVVLGQKTFKDTIFEMSEKLQGKLSTKVQFRSRSSRISDGIESLTVTLLNQLG